MGKDKLEKSFDKLNKKLFPAGEKQRNEEAEKIMELSDDKLNFDEALDTLLGTSALFVLNRGRSESRMIEYINKKTNQKLNHEEAKSILDFIVNKLVSFADIFGSLLGKAKKFKKDGKLMDALDYYNKAFDLLVTVAHEHASKCKGAIIDKDRTRTITSILFEETRKYLKRDMLAAATSNAMGVIFVKLGDPEGARRMFEQAIELTPDGMDYISAKNNLKELEK